MTDLPRATRLDSTLALLHEGYRFIPARCRRLHSDVFETRLMLRKAICISGPEAARVFYTPDRFTRQGAMPPMTLRLLQDKGSVQTLSGEAHAHRKRMFLDLGAPERADELADVFEKHWRAALPRWQQQGRVALHPALRPVLTGAVCEWAGIELDDHETDVLAGQLGAMIDGAGAVGPRAWIALLRRRRTERWMRRVIEEVRAGRRTPPPRSAVAIVAGHRAGHGELLPPAVAAVELINVLRATVAVDRFIVFAALALHDHPEWRGRLQHGDDGELQRFVQEVRRFYPFFPLIGGRVQQPFDWRGHHFANGTWVILDLYGTNHDARAWTDPDTFRPERFETWDGDAYDFVPQGGGEHEPDHRCPGEWMTIAVTKRAVRLLTSAMDYDVPAQDLAVDLGRMPALPGSGFVIERVRPAGVSATAAAHPG